jgi:NADH-quinone oxidoreductase subunit M
VLDTNILTLITLFPLVGAVIVAFLPRNGKVIQAFTLLVTLVTFFLTLHLPAHFAYGRGGFQFEQNFLWIINPAIRYHVGVDGISMWLVVLTGLLAPIGTLASWNAIETRTKEFYFFFLVQQTAMYGVFVSLDLILYYGYWELSLVPMAILIAMHGRTQGQTSTRAAIKFFLYTFTPSALFLVAILALYAKTGTFDYVLMQQALQGQPALFGPQALYWISLAFLVAFAVKVPVFPLHGWLGDVFSEAPTAMAMVVSGKLGIYSILRFHLGLFPVQARQIAPLMIALAALGIVYGALVALVQKDMKRLLAFGTLSSLSFCVLGIYSFAASGLSGALFHIISESITAAAMFVLFGLIYERYSTYDIAQYGGLASRMPKVTVLFIIAMLSMIGLPILNGFVGEFLTLSSGFAVNHTWGTIATTGVILSASYMLWMVQRIFYGVNSPMVERTATIDLLPREATTLWPVAGLMLAMGVASTYWFQAINQGVAPLATHTIAADSAARTEASQEVR